MTVKELFEQGGKAVGNLIVLHGGKTILIGDVGINQSFDGLLNQEVTFIANVLEGMDNRIEQIQQRSAI